MRRLMFYLLFIIGVTACYDEDPILAEKGEPRYNLEDDPSDPVQHYVYDFYTKCKTIILTNPTVYDYKFNFSMKNRITMVAPEQDKDLLYKGIQYIEKVFFDVYTPEFKAKFFPVSIIMADTIRDAGFGSEDLQNSVSSTNFVAIGNIRKGVVDRFTPEELLQLKAEINGKFWSGYMAGAKHFFVVDSAFYKVSKDNYGKVVISPWDDEGKMLDDIDFYEMGFVSYDPETSSVDPDFLWIQNPSEAVDLAQWLSFIFEKTSAEMKVICDKYPKMKEKYEVLHQGMVKCSGFDISKMGN